MRTVPALLLAAGVLAACELTTVEVAAPEDVVVVEAYLRTDAAEQEVFLYRTLDGDRPLRVDGARIRVRALDAGASVAELVYEPSPDEGWCARYTAFPEGEGGSCYVASQRRFVRPGASYALEVVLQDGRVVEGRTTVPGDFRVLDPAADSCVLESVSYPLVWSESDGAWAYQAVALFHGLAEGLRERGVEDPPDELELTGLAVGAADTTIVFPGEFGVFDRFTVDRDLLLALGEGLPAGAAAKVVIAAGDRNFVNWVRGGNFNPSGPVRVPSVTGDGTGVFGSLVVRDRVLLGGSGAEDEPPSCR
jgi:hypothetical protein